MEDNIQSQKKNKVGSFDMINDSFEYESQTKLYLSKYFKAIINGEKMHKGY